MKAIVMTQPGGPDVLRLVDLPKPQIRADNQILVKLKAAGVNPIDTKLRAKGSSYYPKSLPAVLGCDGAGIVEAVGRGVTRFREGDAVYFCHGGIGGPPGNYAEYTLVEEDFAAPKPRRLNFLQTAALPLTLITAWESLHDRAGIRSGDKVLIHAGAGGVGHIAIQLARIAGCAVCTTVGSTASAEFAQALGAEKVVQYRKDDFVAETLHWTGGIGVDAALDTVGGKTFADTVRAMRIYGDLVTLLQPGADMDWTLARQRNLRISLELMLTPMYAGPGSAVRHQADILRQGAVLVDDGLLECRVHAAFPLREAGDAHRMLEAGGMHGKLVLTIED